MTFEEVKKILKDYRSAKKQLESEQLRLEQLQNDLIGIKAVRFDRQNVQNSPKGNSYKETIIDRISVLETRCNDLMKKVFEIEDIIADNMHTLTPCEQAMIIDRYMHGWSWNKICIKYHYCREHAERLTNKAIRKMAK